MGKNVWLLKKLFSLYRKAMGYCFTPPRFLRVANQHTIDPKHTIPAPCQNVMDKGALIKNDDTTADNTGMK